MGDQRISISESNYEPQIQAQHISYKHIITKFQRWKMKKATPNKVQQKDDDLTSKTSEPDQQINHDLNNPSNNLITPIINNKSQITQNKTAIATNSSNIDDNNTSMQTYLTNNAEFTNNSINDNVTKEAEKGQSHIRLLNWRKTRKTIDVETPKRGLYNSNLNGGHDTQQKTNQFSN